MYSPLPGPLWTKTGLFISNLFLWSTDRVSYMDSDSFLPLGDSGRPAGAGTGHLTTFRQRSLVRWWCFWNSRMRAQSVLLDSRHGDYGGMSKTLWYWGKAILELPGMMYFPILNEEPFGTPESSWHPTHRSWKMVTSHLRSFSPTGAESFRSTKNPMRT